MVFVAILITVILGFAALAVDVGSITMDRRDLQNAADAIALAASQELPDQDEATAVANQWAANNDIPLSAMTLTFTAQSLPTEPNPKVTVQLTETHDFYFARVVGVSSADVHARATAIRTSSGGSNGLMPWSVTKAIKDAATPGQSVVLKYDAGNSTNGNFGAIRLDGNGANIYRTTIINGSTTGYCSDVVADCPYATTVQTETGNMRGPTEVGTDYRLDNTVAGCDTWDEVVQVNPDGTQGLRPECNPFAEAGDQGSLQVIVIPIISSLCNGSCSVTIKEFALFYLEGYGPAGCASGNTCEVEGRFISSNTNYGALTGVFDEDTLAHFVRLVE